MAKEATLQVRMDAELKEAAERLYKELGTSFAEAVRIFAKQSVREQGIPFTINVERKSAYGMLAQYADPAKIAEEQDAFAEAVSEKYGKAD